MIGNHRHLKTTLPPKLPSAAELAAGDFLHLRRPYDYQSDHLGPLNPLVASAFRTEPPFAGDDRRSPAPLRQMEGDDAGDWSNLTSGPGGPTVRDPAPVHVVKWRHKGCKYVFSAPKA